MKNKKDNFIIPTHIAFIMDGNGRWANARGLNRTEGHKKGSETLRSLIKAINAMGIKYATFYAFSTENWKRPKEEVDTLMNLFARYIDELIDRKGDNSNVRLCFAGDRTKLSKNLQDKMAICEKNSEDNNGTLVTICINYGGRDELTNCALSISKLFKDNKICENDIDQALVNSFLYTNEIPDVDLLIRTGGEKRLSNFLIWQSAYAELYFCDTLWPDFGEKELNCALEEFAGRNRRFGGL